MRAPDLLRFWTISRDLPESLRGCTTATLIPSKDSMEGPKNGWMLSTGLVWERRKRRTGTFTEEMSTSRQSLLRRPSDSTTTPSTESGGTARTMESAHSHLVPYRMAGMPRSREALLRAGVLLPVIKIE